VILVLVWEKKRNLQAYFIRCSYETSNVVEREIRPNPGLEFRTKAQNPGSSKSFKF
jgi:hypothetical protein